MKKKVVRKKVPQGKAKGWDKQVDKELPEHAKGKAKGHDKIEERQEARAAMRDAKTLQELNRIAKEVKAEKKRHNLVLLAFAAFVAAALAVNYFYG